MKTKDADVVKFFLSDRIVKGEYDNDVDEAGVRSRQVMAVIDFICEIVPSAVREWLDEIPRETGARVAEFDFIGKISQLEMHVRGLSELRDDLGKQLREARGDLLTAQHKADANNNLYQNTKSELEEARLEIAEMISSLKCFTELHDPEACA